MMAGMDHLWMDVFLASVLSIMNIRFNWNPGLLFLESFWTGITPDLWFLLQDTEIFIFRTTEKVKTYTQRPVSDRLNLGFFIILYSSFFQSL